MTNSLFGLTQSRSFVARSEELHFDRATTWRTRLARSRTWPPSPERLLDFATAVYAGVGQFMIALDIARMQPLAEFEARMERYIAELKSVPLAQGYEEILYPGEMEARNEQRNRAEGLVFPEDTLTDSRKLASEYTLTSQLPF